MGVRAAPAGARELADWFERKRENAVAVEPRRRRIVLDGRAIVARREATAPLYSGGAGLQTRKRVARRFRDRSGDMAHRSRQLVQCDRVWIAHACESAARGGRRCGDRWDEQPQENETAARHQNSTEC